MLITLTLEKIWLSLEHLTESQKSNSNGQSLYFIKSRVFSTITVDVFSTDSYDKTITFV